VLWVELAGVAGRSERCFTAGEYHLGFTYERDITAQHQNSQVLRQAGSAEPELVIDVPWETAT